MMIVVPGRSHRVNPVSVASARQATTQPPTLHLAQLVMLASTTLAPSKINAASVPRGTTLLLLGNLLASLVTGASSRRPLVARDVSFALTGTRPAKVLLRVRSAQRVATWLRAAPPVLLVPQVLYRMLAQCHAPLAILVRSLLLMRLRV